MKRAVAQQRGSDAVVILGVIIIAFGLALVALAGTPALSRVERAYQQENV